MSLDFAPQGQMVEFVCIGEPVRGTWKNALYVSAIRGERISIMVWGGIHEGGTTPLVDVSNNPCGMTAQGYMYIDEVLDPVVVPYIHVC